MRRMDRRQRPVWLQVSLVILVASVSLAVLGCGTSGTSAPSSSAATSGSSAQAGPQTTSDGLVRVEAYTDGELYLRPDHGIGGYDAIVVAPAFVNYRRTSARLDPDDEELYLVAIEQALVDEANELGAPIEYGVGECVIKVGAGFINVDLARSASAQVLGEMILVIEYQDSLSGESLLRLMVPERIERESGNTTRYEQVSQSFEQMIDEVDITVAIRSATGTPSAPRPGCDGNLVRAGLPDEET